MRKIYFISDTHFDHVNIIKYCNRPFSSVEEMNETIIKNWNKVVRDKDLVYFLGDFVLSKNKKERVREYCEQLNGEIIFIRGNHDKIGDKFKIISHKDIRFMLIHNPDSCNALNFEGWVIHGHHHGNFLDKYPFFNWKEKRINVSVEVVNYMPISLDLIIKLIKKEKQNIKKIDDLFINKEVI
ncbi:metallophosphoesterase [Methanocaldococcus vulcanius]|nr:metallophosphoesterase [Methanocaldococcus vulcanius]